MMYYPTISYFPARDKLLLKFKKNIKGKPTQEFGAYKLWFNKKGNMIDAIAIIPYSEEQKEFNDQLG